MRIAHDFTSDITVAVEIALALANDVGYANARAVMQAVRGCWRAHWQPGGFRMALGRPTAPIERTAIGRRQYLRVQTQQVKEG
jgi:hypothetical protein